MGIWTNITPQTVENAKDFYPQFKDGENRAFIKSVELKVSSKGNDMLEIVFSNDEGGRVWHYIVDDDYKYGKFKQLSIAFNIPFGSMDTDSWVGKRGIVVCKMEEYNGKKSPRVQTLLPIRDGTRHNENVSRQQKSEDEFVDDMPADWKNF